MSNTEKYIKVFMDTFEVSREEAGRLAYNSVKAWDSVGHMLMINKMEAAFGIYFEVEDIVDFSSFEAGRELLKKYDVEFD